MPGAMDGRGRGGCAGAPPTPAVKGGVPAAAPMPIAAAPPSCCGGWMSLKSRCQPWSAAKARRNVNSKHPVPQKPRSGPEGLALVDENIAWAVC